MLNHLRLTIGATLVVVGFGLSAGCSGPSGPDGGSIETGTIIIEGMHDEPWVEFAWESDSWVISVHSFAPRCAEHIPADQAVVGGDLRVTPRYRIAGTVGVACPDGGATYLDEIVIRPSEVANGRLVLRGRKFSAREIVEVAIAFPDPPAASR